MVESETHDRPRVGIVMGSRSDWPTMEQASKVLRELEIEHDCKVVSAHRTPKWMWTYATTADLRGLEVVIAGAGGAAHLPGMIASMTPLPVLGVPVQSKALNGIDSLLSIVQMPAGVPVGTLAIGTAGATNAGWLAARILALHDEELRKRLNERRDAVEQTVLDDHEINFEDEASHEKN